MTLRVLTLSLLLVILPFSKVMAENAEESTLKSVIEGFTHHSFDEGTFQMDENYEFVDTDATDFMKFLETRNHNITERFKALGIQVIKLLESEYTYTVLEIEGDKAFAEYKRWAMTVENDDGVNHETGHQLDYTVELKKVGENWKVVKALSSSPWNDEFIPREYRFEVKKEKIQDALDLSSKGIDPNVREVISAEQVKEKKAEFDRLSYHVEQSEIEKTLQTRQEETDFILQRGRMMLECFLKPLGN